MEKFQEGGAEAVDRVFAALADPTRRAIIARLSQSEATLSELAAPHRMTLPAVMKHVGILADAGVVTRRKEGRVVTCALAAMRLEIARDWLDRHLAFWTARLDALEHMLDEPADRHPAAQRRMPPRSRLTPAMPPRKPPRRRPTE